ncbi:hypothetical protein ABH926_000567 [Catenulispora sp. GP43]|uniref:hypothetical protein n=1 Tax=Catenulispora sp. GP43 TaxID=3156263 RepID=UPI00351113C6
MRRCQHSCGCEGNAVGRDPDSGLLLCAACLGRSILGTDCSRARKYFGHRPVRFVNAAWTEPPPLRNGDRSRVPEGFEMFLTVRTEPGAAAWDFLPLARVGAGAATNPQRPPKDPPPGPLPPPPARPVQPNPPRR